MPRRQLLVLLAALTAFAPMALDLYLPGFPDIAATYGTDTGSVQLTLSACLLGLGLGQLTWGPTSDRYGRKRPLLAGLVISIVASLLIAVAPTFAAMVVLRFLQAFGGSAGVVIARAIVRDRYSGVELARTLSAIVTVFAIAPVVAPLIGSAILQVAPWPWMFVALAVFGVLCLLGVVRMPESLPVERRTDHGFVGAMAQYRSIMANAEFRYAAALSALGSTALFAYIASSPALVIDYYGGSESLFAVIFAGLSVAFAAGAQLNMRLLRVTGVGTLLARAVFVQFAGGLVLVAAAAVGVPLGVFLVPLAITVMTVSAVTSNGIALGLGPFPHAAASAAALIGGAQMLMGAISSSAMSALPLDAPVEMSLAMSAAAGLGSAIVLMHRARARSIARG